VPTVRQELNIYIEQCVVFRPVEWLAELEETGLYGVVKWRGVGVYLLGTSV
jgi:hypothetical protein